VKSIFLIGVGEIGLNQIRWAQDAGFFVITSNMDPDAPAFKLADVGVVLNGSDTRSLVGYALENQERYNILAVYSGNDFGVFSASCVAQSLKVPSPSVAAVSRGLSKTLMKTCWAHNGVPTPAFQMVRTETEARQCAELFGMPIILKPPDSSGSQGIQVIEKMGELEPALDRAFRYSKRDQMIIEKHVDGRHIDANAFFWGDRFYATGLSERYFSPIPYRVPIGGYEPAILSVDEKDMVNTVFEKATRALGINQGPVKGDFILNSEGIHVIEVSARFHGDVGTCHSTFYRTGHSHLQAYFETLFTRRVPFQLIDDIASSTRISGWRVLDLPEGHSTNLRRIISKCSELDGVDDVFIRPRRPEVASHLHNNNDVVGFVWASGKSKQLVDAALDGFKSELRENLNFQ
jgi:biotin carboxylase